MSTPPTAPAHVEPQTLPALYAQLDDVMLADVSRLRRRLDSARGTRAGKHNAIERIAAQITTAKARAEQRRSSVPPIAYPEELPVSQRRSEIADAIREHQVVILAGETGSGKTTQLPKICLEVGRGVRGMIGHTQPRRIAARTVAERIAEELGTPLGQVVGYQVRFTAQVSQCTLVKLMTDGILLAETQHDRMLYAYDTLIIDEAHERSLNIDFILGYVRQLLPQRPDLRVVITSATIEPYRFSRHFGDAPVIEVSGRTYPVEVRYRPLDKAVPNPEDTTHAGTAAGAAATDRIRGDPDGVRDQVQAICDAVDELSAEGPGDILVFLSGEREIRDAADALRRKSLRHTEVLPLYARLSAAEQHRVFQPGTGRRIVLATNVAETSLTVPGIRYVIDPGTARISRYSQRLKVQRLPIEAISQASANQRMGRCGRLSDGICIRLYSHADFQTRPEFTDPEVLRTNLASVILQMATLDLGPIDSFGFIDPPDRRSINDGVALLQELGAFDPAIKDSRKRLTELGRRLAHLPIDPRLGRMVLAAHANGCLREILVITAALSIQDPRERPLERREAATQMHARFRDPDSDFIAYLNLWDYLRQQQKALSSSQFRRMCTAEFLNYLRVREWQDLEGQLRQIATSMGMSRNREPATPHQMHVSLLAGLLSHIGMKDIEKPEYLGARGARFAIFPSSVLFRRNARWVMAAELVETSRLWGRVAARIEPEWAESLAGHLIRRSYSEPHWDAEQGSAMAFEKLTLYGLPLVAARKIHYGHVNPKVSRQLFIRHALVEGDWRTEHAFFERNRAMLEDAEELEHRSRRRDIVVDDEVLVTFYDERIPSDVVSARHFDSWWRTARRTHPDLLTFDPTMLIGSAAAGVDRAAYPDTWQQGEHRFALTYQFAPGAHADGVTVHIPVAVLGQVASDGFDWQIPGLRTDLVTALIRSLPKALRRNFVPVPEYAQAFLHEAAPGRQSILDTLAEYLHRHSGVPVAARDFSPTKVPDHLRLTFRIDDGSVAVGEGKDLAELQRRLAPQSQQAVAELVDDIEQTGLTAWNPGTLAKVVQRRRAGQAVTGYPALVDESDSVAVRVFPTAQEQTRAMWAGTRRLLLLSVPSPVPLLSRRLTAATKLGLTRYPYRTVPQLLDDCVACAVDALVERAGGPAWDDEGYAALEHSVRDGLVAMTVDVVVAVEKIVAAAHKTRAALASGGPHQEALDDMRSQLVRLLQPGFVCATGFDRLADIPRYLRGIQRRWEKLANNPGRDREWMAQVEGVQAEYDDLLASVAPARRDEPAIREIRWMIEELRISYFAQELRTAYPVSDIRLYRLMDKLR